MQSFTETRISEAMVFLMDNYRLMQKRHPPGSCFPKVLADAYDDVDVQAVREWGDDAVEAAKIRLECS